MKRFYCTVCKKIKRTQKWPTLIQNQHSEDAHLRLGECNRHYTARNESKVITLRRGVR